MGIQYAVGGWLRRLAERAGIRRRAHRLPDWATQDVRRAVEGTHSHSEIASIPAIPTALRRRLQEEAVQQTFYRLETPLKLLLYATEPGQEPRSIQEYRDILSLWRHGLEREARLVPDAYSIAAIPYEPALGHAYHIDGGCEVGDAVRVTVPAWRLHGEVVVRGLAEPMVAADAV